MGLLLEHGYHGLGVQALLDAAHTAKGSFYHHFRDKEDFALQVIDRYMQNVHVALDECLADTRKLPLDRIRNFFVLTARSYHEEGYMGCLLGGLGQELSGENEVFREKIETCFTYIASRTATCLEEARRRGDIPATANTRRMADLLVDCWEGAALRSRLRKNSRPLHAMLDFFFESAA